MSIGTPNIEVMPEWVNYVDLQNDVLPYLQIQSSEYSGFDIGRQTLINTYIDAACWWAQDYLNQPIAPTTFFRRFNGYTGFGGSMISLPYAPVLEVPTVVEWWGSSGPHTLSLQTPESQGDSFMFTLDAPQGLIIRSYLGLLQMPLFPGLKNIEVTWVAGRNPIPAHWRKATLELIKYWWDNEQQAGRPGGVLVPGANVYDNPAPGHTGLMPAVPDAIEQQFMPAKRIGFA